MNVCIVKAASKRPSGLARRGGEAPALRQQDQDLGALRSQLFRRALMMTGQPDRADDMAQDAIIKALACRSSLRVGSDLCGWSMSVMRNAFFDDCRRQRAWHRISGLLREVPAENELADPWIDLLSMADVEAVARSLKETDRELFRLSYLEDLSYREIARRLALRLNTTGTRLFRVRAKLRVGLQRILDERLAARPLVHRG
ncbi:MAG TPA: RNA polymerase sigma factor [Polyangia bacterium]|nr:RNA polymerase sigma factor [Polyangia bacterium]